MENIIFIITRLVLPDNNIDNNNNDKLSFIRKYLILISNALFA